jgi:predicted Na+-dependent transporter
MSTLSRFRPDELTIAMLATVMLSLLLPCQGTSAVVFQWLTGAAIALLFFFRGARQSRAAILAGALQHTNALHARLSQNPTEEQMGFSFRNHCSSELKCVCRWFNSAPWAP